MKKLLRLLLLCCSLIACTLSFPVLGAQAADTERTVTLTSSADEIKEYADVLTDLDLDAGFEIPYTISSFGVPSGNDVKEKRAKDTDWVMFSFVNEGGNGFKIKVRMFNGDETYRYNRMQADLYAVESGKETYLETVETYRKIFAEEHSVSVSEYMGYVYISADGVSFIPTSEVTAEGNAKLSVTMKSTAEATIQLSSTKPSAAPVSGEWSTFGQTEITAQPDGTTEFNLCDRRADQYNGRLTVMREKVINLRGYDVTKPIVLEYSYDIAKTMGIWYGICLGRSPFGDLTKLVYNADGTVKSDITSDNMIASDGIMFQMGTSKVQSQVQNGLLSSYISNQGTTGYLGSENLDKLVIEIGETSTKMTFNGDVIFESLTSKRSDFKDGKCYPYFHFIGSPANPYKENKVIIRGINTPSYEEIESARIEKGSLGMVNFTIENYDNSNGPMKLYYDSGRTNEIGEDKYIYNSQNKTLSVSIAAFESYPFGENTFYAANNGGVTEISFRLVDPNVGIESPSAVGTVEYDGAGDLKFEIDLKGAEFSRFYGNGISRSDYSVTEEDEKSYITVSAAFMQKLTEKEYVFRLANVNVNGDTAEGEVKVFIGVSSEGKGCAGNAGVGQASLFSGVGIILSGMIFAAVTKKRKEGKK